MGIVTALSDLVSLTETSGSGYTGVVDVGFTGSGYRGTEVLGRGVADFSFALKLGEYVADLIVVFPA